MSHWIETYLQANVVHLDEGCTVCAMGDES